MGHISIDDTRKLVKDGLVTGVQLEYMPIGNSFFGSLCVYAKATWKSVPKKREGQRAEDFGGEVHSDLWRKFPVESQGRKKCYITFINDKTYLTHLYLLQTKDEAPKAYKQYEAWVEVNIGKKIKVLNTDQGGEYQRADFVKYLKSKGTHQKLNVHDMLELQSEELNHRRTDLSTFACQRPSKVLVGESSTSHCVVTEQNHYESSRWYI